MRIELNQVEKIEGHGSLMALLNNGKFAEARFSTLEGSRLIEGILRGRDYNDAPLITSRICGVCPVVHNLCAIEAVEAALKVKPTEAIRILRRMMLASQFIHSHSLHVYFMCLPDYFDVPGALELADKLPKAAQKALQLRKFGNHLIEVIGGRAVHPVNSQIGGFLRQPDEAELQKLFEQIPKLVESALELAELMARQPYPEFNRPSESLSLTRLNEYAIYDGDITSSWEGRLTPRRFVNRIFEEQLPGQLVKRTRYEGRVYKVGALARLNLNASKLKPRAKKLFKSLSWKLPIANSFVNVFAQALEIVECLESIQTELKGWKRLRAPKLKVPVRLKAGIGLAAMEAPRGTLIHTYTLDAFGRIKNLNIITPTAQFISNLEADVRYDLGPKKQFTAKDRKRIAMLVRSYDPCMTCATH